MLRVVVDTNVFVSSLLSKRGQPFAIVEAWNAQKFILVMSSEQQAELQDVFSRPRLIKRCHLSLSEINNLLAQIDLLSQKASGTTVLPVAVRDVKDEKILASAIGGAVDYLVTGDIDLLTLNGKSCTWCAKNCYCSRFY
jgi:putative PIN family toxin of toxin-antitoxin system